MGKRLIAAFNTPPAPPLGVTATPPPDGEGVLVEGGGGGDPAGPQGQEEEAGKTVVNPFPHSLINLKTLVPNDPSWLFLGGVRGLLVVVVRARQNELLLLVK